MYNEPIFLEAIFQERIWGGSKLNSEFGYHIPSEKTGEAWVISAHPNGPSTVKNGPLKGSTLEKAWEEYGELFNKPVENKEAYPLLVKILDANDDLSVQVHPNDQYARQVENQPYGKTECWFVLDAENGAEIILGHHAQSKDELKELANNGEWNSLLRRVPVKAGDFIHVPSGTIHAIGKGIVILETQQSSDITYRVYDYDRVDEKGNKRALHLDSAIEVTNVPHETIAVNHEKQEFQGLSSTKLVNDKYFTVFHWQLNGDVDKELSVDFLQVSVIKGNGVITVNNQEFRIKKGDHFILPATVKEYKLSGQAELIVSHT